MALQLVRRCGNKFCFLHVHFSPLMSLKGYTGEGLLEMMEALISMFTFSSCVVEGLMQIDWGEGGASQGVGCCTCSVLSVSEEEACTL